MASELTTSGLETRIRTKLQGVLGSVSLYRGIAGTLQHWGRRGWGPILFGGVVRDVIIFGARRIPRDFDIVISNASMDELVVELKSVSPRLNRFGGFHFSLDRWNCDVWPLEMTWGFRKNHHWAPTFENLPKTTFLNVEAIAVRVDEDGRIGSIAEGGFFEALRSKMLDINYEDNPYPPLAAVRSLITAKKLNFSVSNRLCKYILQTAQQDGTSSLVDAQRSHYGEVRFSESYILGVLSDMDSSVNESLAGSWHFTSESEAQMSLWG